MLRKAAVSRLFVAAVILPTAILGAQTQPSTPPSESDSRFMRTAATAGMAQVELGKLGIQNASSADVRHFAEKMVEDHTKTNGELTALAGKKSVTLPSTLGATHKAIQNKLAKLHGPAFDSAYLAQMIADHKTAVALFQGETKSGKDPDVRAWAAKTLLTVQQHHQTAQTLHMKR